MAHRDIFSKHLPNVKLTTRYDADGKEIQVERREDVDATVKERETFDILVTAGYYRAKIKGLSPFDKVVGGMTWCIECCDYDVDVDLLFHENLTIGQKIALVEKIVSVLPKMKCPFLIEPHQIQGLEFLSIHPVIQWLVKKSVENRARRSERLKRFAISQFHKHHQFQSDKDNLYRIRNASAHIKRIQDVYSCCRQYKRIEPATGDERTRVEMTLMEYDNMRDVVAMRSAGSCARNEMDLEQRFKKLSTDSEMIATLTEALDVERRALLHNNYAELKAELERDSRELSEQSQLEMLEASRIALEKKVSRNMTENAAQDEELRRHEQLLRQDNEMEKELLQRIEEYKAIESQTQPELLHQVTSLMTEHEELKRDELEFKEACRQDLAKLKEEIDQLEALNAQQPEVMAATLAKEKARLQELKLHLAKRNRAIVAVQRQLDSIPDRTELAQYQRRFLELYNQMSAKHLETKQYYTLYNTLNDKKCYMERELSLLNSICEAYSVGMRSAQGREEFVQQFEEIVDGVNRTRDKVQRKYNEEKAKRDGLNEQLQTLLDLQRQYAVAVKQLTKECQRCEQLQQHLQSLQP